MIILGIETSCDETAAAVVENGTKVFSTVVASSQELHAKTGGIIPEQAARKQIESILPVIEEALKKSNFTEKDIYAIAVTYGPGLIGSLLVGVETAKTLSAMWPKPIIPVNHLVAHLYANWISHTSASSHISPTFPAVGLVVSGGHSDLVLMKEHGDIELLGATRDDAAGEAFDKTARLLGLGYPGGPAISKAAEQHLDNQLKLFPRPIIGENSYDFSFSGLKTSVNNYVHKNPDSSRSLLAAEVQEAIVDVLVAKTIKAVSQVKPKSFLLAGGVSANTRLRDKLKEAFEKIEYSPTLYMPDLIYTTDNAAMIASAAYFINKPIPWQEVTANPELSITD